ncbi:MAG: guanylate kinase [Chloroflexi bacterium]|nr:guanylate kinase [Chloroflexota bacterium]MYB22208.1 guanylate kinase [Chloroflexota bacterium]MYD17085.1 guanylate kinase [Chloroflexota bacterium]MYI03329.1 guanylate kinase [Chloroflexota bacterium]
MSPSEPAPLVVVISGPSGAGKDTVINAAMGLDRSLAKVATAKTRAPRQGEVDGVHHVFLSEEEFQRWIAEDAFLEHVTSYGHRSGVPRAAVDDLLDQGRTVVLRTDVEGARTLKQKLDYPFLVFITAPDIASLERRLRSRDAESDEEMAARLAEAEAEMAEADWFDLVIVNHDDGHDRAARQLVDAINARRTQSAGANVTRKV